MIDLYKGDFYDGDIWGECEHCGSVFQGGECSCQGNRIDAASFKEALERIYNERGLWRMNGKTNFYCHTGDHERAKTYSKEQEK